MVKRKREKGVVKGTKEHHKPGAWGERAREEGQVVRMGDGDEEESESEEEDDEE